MKKIFIYFAVVCVFNSCKSQEKVIDIKSTDIIVFNLKNSNIRLPYLRTIYSDSNIVVINKFWAMPPTNFIKYYKFISNKDTMNVKCFCGQEQNLYFTNLTFKKGKYELDFSFPNKYNEKNKNFDYQINYIFGKEIKSPKEVQKILFKNAYPWWESQRHFKDLKFKDLKFIEVDLNDTINVKLKKVEK